MTQKMVELVERNLKLYEAQIRNGMEVPASELEKTSNIFTSFIKNSDEVSDEIKKSYEDRITSLSNFLGNNKKTYITLPKSDVEGVKAFDKSKLKLPAGIVIGAAVAALAAWGLKDCGKEEVVEPVAVEAEAPAPIEEEVQEFTTMSEETKEYSDEIAKAINGSISKGFKVTEENKEEIIKKFINYENIIKLNDLTDEQWATMYQDGNVIGKDLIHDLWDIETVYEKITTVAQSENDVIDFSLLFDGADAEMLNKANSMIIKINTTSGNDRKTAIKEMHDFIIETLTITETRMQYSEVALNTFRGIHVNAFDVLSEYSLTDEEEHAIFTVFANCNDMNDANLKVEDKTIATLQSKFEIYMVEKVEAMLSKNIDAKLNPYDSIDEMVKYIAPQIDLSLYREPADYAEFQKKLFGITGSSKGGKTIKSANASKVSDGKGGVISKKQLAQYGISEDDPAAKTKLEAAVKAEYERNAEATKVTKDINGQVVDPAQANYYTQLGAEDCNRGVNNVSSVPSLYQASYMNGWNAANKAKQEAMSRSSKTETYFEDTTDKVVEQSSTVVEQPYTAPITEPTYSEPVSVPTEPVVETVTETVTEFVPAEETVETVETIETIDYVSSLRNMRDMLVATKNIDTNNSSKSMRV